MSKFVGLGTLFVFSLIVPSFASAKSATSPRTGQYVTATILNVDREEVQSPDYHGGDNPSDSPLRSEYYAYDVSVRIRCGTYVARYETPLDYLPASFAPGRAVPVRVTKHILYFNVPEYQQMRMGIVHRRLDSSGNCGQSDDTR